jgi:UDP-N-acetylglucosamine--N-acetylmuramyl-(pentapeptide) pyrophosphoryl-undecaprenol N-acetylglucosamine transferase
MAGGTGGHIFPAMAVARALINHNAEVHWLGTAAGMEHHLVPAENIPLHLVKVKGFRGKKLLGRLIAPLLLLSAIWQALIIIRKLNPQVVIGFGGYVSAPGGLAARLLGKMLIIHEQNSVAGSTNKLLAKFATQVLQAFPASLPNALLVGNPVRSAVKALYCTKKQTTEKRQKNLLIMGGSLGAEAINTIVPHALAQLPADIRPVVWHQTGKNKLEKVVQSYQSLMIDARTDEFIAAVESAYSWADIIICRAGALTVSEVSVAGVPAIFIPYPYAIDNHQLTNAKWLADQQAAIVIEQDYLTVDTLSAMLKQLLTDAAMLTAMSVQLKKVAMPDATEKVVAVCETACIRGQQHAA